MTNPLMTNTHSKKILLITHAPIGASLLSVLRDILPHYLMDSILVFDIQINDDPEKKIQEAHQLLMKNTSTEILILTDLIGATPYNIARQIMLQLDKKHGALVTGVNLPMLIKTVNYQHLFLEKWVAEITDSALEWIIIEFTRNHLS